MKPSKIPLWFCLEDSRFQEFFYFKVVNDEQIDELLK